MEEYMEKIELAAQQREGIGKGAVKKMRKGGLIPCVLYGPASKEAIPLTVKALELQKALSSTQAKSNVFVNLKIEGDKKKARTVMFRSFQKDLKVLGDPHQTIVLVSAPMAEVEVKTAEEAKAEIAKSFEVKEEEKKAEEPAEKKEEKKK